MGYISLPSLPRPSGSLPGFAQTDLGLNSTSDTDLVPGVTLSNAMSFLSQEKFHRWGGESASELSLLVFWAFGVRGPCEDWGDTQSLSPSVWSSHSPPH